MLAMGLMVLSALTSSAAEAVVRVRADAWMPFNG
jgi:hypothetical protein